jgi:hypothetical protein
MSDIELLTPAEFARLRRCSLRTLDRERATGSGCLYVQLGARIFYRRTDIERHIETNVRGRSADLDAEVPMKHRPGRRRKASNATGVAP